jgi:micrococcal nuclease
MSYVYRGIVVRVIDGDTIEVNLDLGFNLTHRVRMRVDFLDTPETWRPLSPLEKQHGMDATWRAKELLMGEQLGITTSKEVGIYGRYGCSITLPDGRDYATVMKDEGFQKTTYADVDK